MFPSLCSLWRLPGLVLTGVEGTLVQDETFANDAILASVPHSGP